MNDQEYEAELIRLERTLHEIETQLISHEDICTDKQSELRNSLTDYWQSRSGSLSDEAQAVEAVERQRAISSAVHNASSQLKKMLNSPYFGRIDFVEDRESVAEPIYIGISTLTDQKSGEFLVYDWRAPVSGMFYDFEKGEAWYNCPAGIIKGTITLKRQYKIAQGRLQYAFDADLKIDDQILQEILSRSADDKMHTIVNSIQREQNRIIRDEKHRALFVEGPAGSGKTSVALHRIGFLLYRDRHSITSKNILILSPNNLFSDYISNVLPEIGEENVLQMTFQDYVERSFTELPLQFENRATHLENILTSMNEHKQAVRAANIEYKSSVAFNQVMQKYIVWLKTSFVDDYPQIEVQNQIIFTKKDWKYYFSSSFASMPVAVRLIKIREIIRTRLRPIVQALREKHEAQIVASAEEVNKKVIKALARVAAKEELDPITLQVESLTEFKPLTQYLRLFKDEALWASLSDNNQLPVSWKKIKKRTLSSARSGFLPYEDIAPLLYFQGMLQGFPARHEIKHLVIDEAQDYSLFHYQILPQLFPNCSWTVVGDPAQAVHPYLRPASFTEAEKLIQVEQACQLQLTRSYRSTREIQRFCQSLLPPKNQVESVNRSGLLPQIIQAATKQAEIQTLSHWICHLKSEGHHSIALISKTVQEALEFYGVLKDHFDLKLVAKEEEPFYRGIIVIPSYLAKGLEFDAVLAVNTDALHYSHQADRPILYTICTRALHRLLLFYSDTPSPFITQISQDLYETPTKITI